MDDSSSVAANAARAIAAAIDWSSSADVRKAAVAYLESVKNGDIRTLASTSFILVKKDQSAEIRLHGFKMLQHLVRLRWEEFCIAERRNFASAAMNLIVEMVDPREEWALKSQTAALVAEVLRREGLYLWQEILPSLTSILGRGPVEGELVAMLLRWLPEDITVHNEDLEGDRRRELLRGLTQSLPEILPLLYMLLERHFGAAVADAQSQNFSEAKLNAATVMATLNAINAYAEWAPVSDFARYGLIKGCGFLLSSFEFRLHACEIFKLLSQRKRPADESASDFDSALESIFQILINVSVDFLQRSNVDATGIDESEFEFVECVCESMASLGLLSLHYVARKETIIPLYMQQMLGYYQHFKLAIHFQSLQFWLPFLREITSKSKMTAQISGEDMGGGTTSSTGFMSFSSEKRILVALIEDDVCGALLDVSFQRMLRKTALSGSVQLPGILELWSDDFDGKSTFSHYRSRLLDLIRLVTAHKPTVAITKVCQKMNSIMGNYSHEPASVQVLPLLESMLLGLETVIGTAFDGQLELVNSTTEVKFEACRTIEGLLQQFLSLSWKEPALVVLLGRYLDVYGPFLRCFPDSVGGVIHKLFELLTSLPCVLKDPSANSARQARLQLCSSFIRIAKTAGKSLLPHIRVIADTMGILEAEGRLLRGERNLLSEAFLLMASSAGVQQQQEVLAWLLEPLSRQWTQLDWQNSFLSEPLGLARLCSDTQFMWSIYHCVTFFEKALKRSGTKKSTSMLYASTTIDNPTASINPLASHLSWMLPPLLKLLRCIHSLWSHPIALSLPTELKAAMSMSPVDQAGLLGEGVSKVPKYQFADISHNEANDEGLAESMENDLRNWLKGIRDSGYNVLGMSATVGECFFRCLDSTDVAVALMENIQWMEFRHIRQLVHLAVVPIVKFCPPNLWEIWIEKLLCPLFVHCQEALSSSWSNLLHEGRAKVPDTFSNLHGLDLKLEVMEEKLLRALTREICTLLSVAASPALNSGIPSLDQLGSTYRADVPLKNLDSFVSSSLTCFLLMHKDLALPALQITLQAFAWTDGEAVSKVATFCGVVILLAVSSNNIDLRGFVAKDLFLAVVQSLTLESNAIICSELVSLCREIFFYLSNRDPSPRQVLLSVSGISLGDLHAFEDALGNTSSPREQKQLMRSLLMLATGNKFKALAAQRTTAITNVSVKPRGSTPVAGNDNDDETIGLAAIT